MWMTNCWIGSSAISASESNVQKLTVTFRKGEDARFLSHLDLTATLEYAVRRARLPVALSEGFSPRPTSLGGRLSGVGVRGRSGDSRDHAA